jgi:hypothetical protein
MQQQVSQEEVNPSIPYAYHEAGHAVVGHSIGRMIALVSIQKEKEHRGGCFFDAFAESGSGRSQWQKGNQNLELITILYAGTVAVYILCERKGWDYDIWQAMDLRDLAEIDHISRQMFPDDTQREAALDGGWEHAYDLLTKHWNAIETLATDLVTLGWVTGAEAHTIIRQAIGEKNDDWRLDILKDDPVNQQRAVFDATRKQLTDDFVSSAITEQEMKEEFGLLRQKREKLLRSSAAWEWYRSLTSYEKQE